MKYALIIFIALTLFSFSCKKEGPIGPSGKDGSTDKQVRFQLGYNCNNGLSDTFICTIENSSVGLDQFNIKNYVGVDSAIFVIYDAKTSEGCCDAPDIVGTMKIELFDLTHNVTIEKSEIITDDIAKGSFKTSKNIVASFPNETIDLGVRITSSNSIFASTGRLYLFLYRR